jgi:transposase
MASDPYYQERISLIKSIPGIGLINALVFITEIENILRFKNLDKLCAYFGLVPDVYSSGDNEYIKGMTSRGNSHLRDAIIESAWQIIRKEPAMMLAYKNYCVRMESNKAIIKIARKLVARIRYVLIQKIPYQIGVIK